MNAPLSMDLYYSASDYVDEGGRVMELDGDLAGFEGSVTAVTFDRVYMYSASVGGACELEPSGTLSVRAEDGGWYDVDFQGPSDSDAIAFPPDCDGCGQVFYRGEWLGEVCPDLTPLLNWELEPWHN